MCCGVLRRVAVCCSVLQCVAVCVPEIQNAQTLQCVLQIFVIFRNQNKYTVLQCVAVCCRVLPCVAVCFCVLPCVAVCCSVLQCVAVCCSVLQCVADVGDTHNSKRRPCLAVCCIVLQCVAVCERETLMQCVAVYNIACCRVLYGVLQCVAVCCSVNRGMTRSHATRLTNASHDYTVCEMSDWLADV